MSDFVPLNKLITALKAATSSGKSGAFFITTQDQHSAMVTLKGGAITGIKFRNTRGQEAAAALAKIESLKYQSAAEPTELPGESALDTATVLEILTTGEAAASAAEPGAGGAPPAPGSAAGAAASPVVRISRTVAVLSADSPGSSVGSAAN